MESGLDWRMRQSVVGLVVGGLAGAVLGLFFVMRWCRQVGCDFVGLAYLLAGMVVGAIVGAVVGFVGIYLLAKKYE